MKKNIKIFIFARKNSKGIKNKNLVKLKSKPLIFYSLKIAKQIVKKEDKVKGTGRFHIMKNRYGTDGLTFAVKADTSTGHFEVHHYNTDFEEENLTPNHQSNRFDVDTDSYEKRSLHSKFDLLKTEIKE